MARLLSGVAISARYFLLNAFHSAGVLAACPSFNVSTLGARFGNHTSYQFRVANSVFGTPRGGRRTVPMRMPSPGVLWLPNRTTRTAMAHSHRTPDATAAASQLAQESRHIVVQAGLL